MTGRTRPGGRDRATAATSPRSVWFDETGEERPVVGYCRVCKSDPSVWPPLLVSPQGIVHDTEYEVTLCGHDATGPDWWWRI